MTRKTGDHQTRIVEIGELRLELNYQIGSDVLAMSLTHKPSYFSIGSTGVTAVEAAFLLSTLVETLGELHLPNEGSEKPRMVRLNAAAKAFLEAIR